MNKEENKEISSEVKMGENLSLKERRMELAGATREAAYKALVEGLKSEVMVLDKFGGEHLTPDTNARLRASELILKMRGDIRAENVVENKVINITIDQVRFDSMINWVKDMNFQLKELKTSGQQTGEIIDIIAE